MVDFELKIIVTLEFLIILGTRWAGSKSSWTKRANKNSNATPAGRRWTNSSPSIRSRSTWSLNASVSKTSSVSLTKDWYVFASVSFIQSVSSLGGIHRMTLTRFTFEFQSGKWLLDYAQIKTQWETSPNKL